MPGQYPPQQQFAGQAAANAYDVSEVTLQTQPGPGGSQMVVTPRGMVVPLPGQGVNSNVVQVYMGGQGGFWYIDKNGQQVDLTPAVHAMQQMGTPAQQAAVPQYAPQPQVVNNYNAPQQQGGGGSGAGALGAAAAVGMGAMAGSAIANSMYQNQVPYGTPIHYGANAVPYYNQGGKPVYINNSTNAAEFNQINNQHMTAMQQQQSWYKEQQVAQNSNWKNWQQAGTANPFVGSAYQNPQAAAAAGAAADQYHNNNVQQQHEEQAAAADHYHNNNMQQQKNEENAAAADHYHNNNAAAASQHNGAGAAAASSESHGRFGRGAAAGEGGGRFGKGAAGEASGGRFAKAEGGAESGGRLGDKAGGRSRGRLRGER